MDRVKEYESLKEQLENGPCIIWPMAVVMSSVDLFLAWISSFHTTCIKIPHDVSDIIPT